MGVCGNIVQELMAGLFQSFGALGLAGDNDTEGSSQCGVIRSCIVEKYTHDIWMYLISFGESVMVWLGQGVDIW